MMRDYEQKLAAKYSECRAFIEFAAAHRKLYKKWLDKEIEKLMVKK